MFILSMYYTDQAIFERVLGPEGYAKIKDLDIEEIINDIDFEFNMDADKIKSVSQKMNGALQLLQYLPNLKDAAGNPIVDPVPVVDMILEGLGMSGSVKFTVEDAQASAELAGEIKKAFDAVAPQQPSPQPGAAPASTPTPPQPAADPVAGVDPIQSQLQAG